MRAIAIVLGISFLASSTQCFALERTITVTGTAQTMVTPDHATIEIGVKTRGQTVGEAIRLNAPTMKAVIDALIASGIPRSDLQTESFEVEQAHPQLPNGAPDTEKTIGYDADNEIRVSLSAMDRIGEIIDTAVRAGATYTGQITFSIKNADPVLNQVRAEAMRNAREKAVALVEPEHKKVGELLAVGTGISGLREDFGRGYYASSPIAVVPTSGVVATEIVPQQIPISETVTATFALQ